jgi:D-aspartate ligase
VRSSAPEDGRMWLVEDLDLLSSLRYHREGTLSMRQWLSSMRGVDELAWCARDDLAPAAALIRFRAAQTVRRRPQRRATS